MNEILNIMKTTLAKPREQKPNRPVIEKLEIPIAKRSKFLGIGGLNLRLLTAETGCVCVKFCTQ